MNRKISLFTILCFAVSYQCFAQSHNIVPPSPETASLFNFQEYPMDYSTGLPQISIPLYVAKNGSLSVPISMSYHASGCKVSDRDGPIAVGWSLNAGGMISRTVHGSEDFGEYPFPYPFEKTNINHTNNLSDLGYLEKIVHFDKNTSLAPPGEWLDSEYDVFSYAFLNHTGKFIFKDQNGTKTPVLLPNKPFVVTPLASPSLGSIEIIDDKGIYYKFGGRESVGVGGPYTGYSLEQMISADKTDTIDFIYLSSVQKRISRSQSIKVTDQWSESSGVDTIDPMVETTNNDSYQIARLSEIRFRQGRVKFNLISLGGNDLINNIQVINKNNDVIKTFQFDRSTLHNLAEMGYATHKLNQLVIKDNKGSETMKYLFEHYPTSYSGINDGNSTQLNYRYIDWWGYYNVSGQFEMVPYHSNQTVQANIFSPVYNDLNVGNINAKRTPDLNGLKSGVLKKITYPTGGSKEFFYEHNKFKSLLTNQITNGPGLRVSSITTIDNSGNTYNRNFKYGIGESGYGFIDLEPTLDKMKTQYTYDYFRTTPSEARKYHRVRIFYSGFAPELAELASRPIIYTEVTEYKGTSTDNTGKSIYTYDRIPWGASGLGPQKWRISNYKYWNNPSLKTQTDFKSIQNGGAPSYEKVREVVNGYTANTIEEVKGLHVQRLRVLPQNAYVLSSGLYPESHAVQEENLMIYVFGEYSIPSGSKKLTSTTETLFGDNGTEISSETTYTYNANNLISQTTQKSSDGGQVESQIKYPFDYTGNPVLTQMMGAGVNMINFPIEQEHFKNGEPTNSIRTNYYNWGGINPMIAPQTTEEKKGNNSYETTLRYFGYDTEGNLTSFSKENNIVHTYIWGYDHAYPVVQIENLPIDQVASSIISNIENHSFLNSDDINNVQLDVNYLKGQLSSLINNPNYRVTLYTYNNLIGMTSQTDPNGITTYYEYDDFGRLQAIKDANGKTLKTHSYHYKSNQ